jgi:hypothetical protein
MNGQGNAYGSYIFTDLVCDLHIHLFSDRSNLTQLESNQIYYHWMDFEG